VLSTEWFDSWRRTWEITAWAAPVTPLGLPYRLRLANPPGATKAPTATALSGTSVTTASAVLTGRGANGAAKEGPEVRALLADS